MNTESNLPAEKELKEPSRLLSDYRHGQGSGHDLTLADPSCKHCYGTGYAGLIRINTGRPLIGKMLDGDKTRLTCACVIRAEAKQKYLKEKEECQKTQKTAEM